MASNLSRAQIAVLGAGLQGCCIALGLARLGYEVSLLERRTAPMQGASAHNEGKIHLGFVYALDQTGATRRRMLEGALSFAPLLEELLGPLPWAAWRSAAFRYAVMPGSLATADRLTSAYEDLESMLPEVAATSPRSPQYVGLNLKQLWRQDHHGRGRPIGNQPVEHSFSTEEVSVDPRKLGPPIAKALHADGRIDLRCGTRVERAERRSDRFLLELQTAGGSVELEADAVVNCTWADRLRLDRSIGLPPEDYVPCYRVKHRVMVRPRKPISDMVPVTMVQGPYGDIVPWNDGMVYLSWYPTCRTYFGSTPPMALSAYPGEPLAVARDTLAIMAKLFPALDGAEIVSSVPCIIIARGEKDVHDRASALHRRDGLGATSHDRWWTVETGKLTTAPLIAHRTVARIHEELRHAVD